MIKALNYSPEFKLQFKAIKNKIKKLIVLTHCMLLSGNKEKRDCRWSGINIIVLIHCVLCIENKEGG